MTSLCLPCLFFFNWHKHFITDKQFCQITSRRYQNWQFLLPNLHVIELSDDAAHCYSSVWLEVAYFMLSAQLCPVKHCREGEGCGRQQVGLENKKLRTENTADLSAVKLEAWWKCLAGASRVCPSSWHAACLSPQQTGCSRNNRLSRHQRQDRIVPSPVKVLTGWPQLTTPVSSFNSASFADQAPLHCPARQLSLTGMLSFDAFTQDILAAESASHCLSVILPNSYLDYLVLGHRITAFNLFCPHVKD